MKVRGKNDNGYFGYQFAMAAAIAAPIIVSQDYLEKASYDLIKTSSAEQVKDFKQEKYFEIETFVVNRNHSLPYVTARTSGKNNQDLIFYLYLSCPFGNTSDLWYGVKYNKRISNFMSDSSKDSEYRHFANRSERDFRKYDFHQVKYFEKLGYSDDRDGFLQAINQAGAQIKESDQIVLVPKTDNFEQRLGSFPWIFGSFGIGALVLLLMVILPKIDEKELDGFKKGKPLHDDDLRDILEFLDPRGSFKATPILLLVNILVFVVMIFAGINIISPTPQELLEIGGNRRSEVLNGGYWRLLSSVFIHGGLIHLIMNLFGLGLGGSLLEYVLGWARLLICFIVCGILASLASIYWHQNTVSVGASGAIFGLFGLILAFTVFKIYPNYMRGTTWMLLGLYAGVSLLFGFLGGIDNAAHIGGLLSGFVIGVILVLLEKEKLIKKASSH